MAGVLVCRRCGVVVLWCWCTGMSVWCGVVVLVYWYVCGMVVLVYWYVGGVVVLVWYCGLAGVLVCRCGVVLV